MAEREHDGADLVELIDPNLDPDGSRDETARMCGYRRCGAVLPKVSGRGNRAKFCQDGKSWGSRDLSCREAEAALVDADSLRDDTVAVDDIAVAALGEQLDRALGPAQTLANLLTETRRQLDTTVTEALAERDAATEQATQAHRLSSLSEEAERTARAQAAEALQAAKDANAAQIAAERQCDNERRARIAAEQAQQRADGQATSLAAELARTINRADAAVQRAGELDRALATLTAELATEKAAAHEQRTRADKTTEELLAAERRHATALSELRDQHDARADKTRDEHRHQLAAAHAETEAVRAKADHESAALRDTINRLNRDLGAAEQHQERAVADRRLATTHLRELAHAVRRALNDSVDGPHQLRTALATIESALSTLADGKGDTRTE